MQLDDVLTDREAQAGAASFLQLTGPDLHKRLKQQLLVLFGHANAFVFHRKRHEVFVLGSKRHRDMDKRVRVTEFDRVRQEVAQDVLQTELIAEYLRRDVASDEILQLNVLCFTLGSVLK